MALFYFAVALLVVTLTARGTEVSVVDALNEPIAGATLKVLWDQPGNWSDITIDEGEEFTTDDAGKVDLPTSINGKRRVGWARVTHPDYGSAQVDIGWDDHPALVLPLVKHGSAAFERAVKGIIVDPEGKPIADALVKCSNARTAGEGLVQSGTNVVVTDAEGKFALYLPDRNDRKERGELIPPGSRYDLGIEAPKDDSLFPAQGEYPAGQRVRITLSRPARSFSFKYKSRNGDEMMDEQKVMREAYITYRPKPRGGSISLPLRYAKGGKLPPGIYEAHIGQIKYLPLTIDENSPDEIVFQPVTAPTFAGRVVDGITGAPMSGVFVLIESSSSNRQLASLEPDDWKVLHQLDAHPKLDDPALKDLHDMYGFTAITRTDETGGYVLKPAPDDQAYNVIAFDQDVLPYARHVRELKPDRENRIAVADLLMFPAARIIVQPNSQDHIAIDPVWRFAKNGQPSWFEKLRAADDRDGQQTHVFPYYNYLTMNEPNGIFVPAGVRLHVDFDLPYNDEWSIPVGTPEVQLGKGETLDLGELLLEPSLAVTVLVVNEKDQPIEGIPVRRWYQNGSGTVAHNTDAKGLAHFDLHPNAKGRFRITDFNDRRRNFPSADFETGKEAPEKPIATIKLSKKDIDTLLKQKRQ